MIRRVLFLLAMSAGIYAQGQPVTLAVRHMPAPVLIDGKPVIYYELWLTAAAATPLSLHQLEIVSTADSSVMATFTADDLQRRYNLSAGPAKENMITAGTPGLLYLEITLPSTRKYPPLIHRLTVIDAGARKYTVAGGVMPLNPSPLVLGQPLRGGPWVAIYEPVWERGHRRVIYTVGDTARIPGRFAIDFSLLNKDGKMSHHNPDSVTNWYSYAADVLAVADGVVAAVVNDFPESLTISGLPTVPTEQGSGNYIALNIGNGRYVFYEHLKPGSISVKPGQRVKKGQRIAALGFTGHTTGPHLHLHVADRNSSLGAEGLPYALEKFTVLGSYPGAKGLGEKPWVPARINQQVITQQRPVPNAVITFP